VVTDTELRTGYRLENVKRLTQFARYDIPTAIQKQILAVVVNLPVATIADVINQVNHEAPQQLLIPILYMAYHHQVIIPLDEAPITPNSPISLPAVAFEEVS
jgi:hypothetical protein